jgi:NADH-quinone oxidoreductase subunit C
MAEENKPQENKVPASSSEGEKPSAEKIAGGVSSGTPPASGAKLPASSEKLPAAPGATPPKPAAPGEKPAAAAAPAKPAAPPKPAGPTPQPWNSPLVAKLTKQFGSGIQPLTYLGQNYLQVDRSLIPTILQMLRDEEQFDYCVDITAVHYPKREKQFEIVWILYSFPKNERVRVKTQIAEGEHIPSAVPVWVGTNWLERETFDMFGIPFDGHPDMKRILLPDGWKGHPLRKDYGIIQQDQEWVQINLGIESGQ